MPRTGQLQYRQIDVNVSGVITTYTLPINATITDIETILNVSTALATTIFNSIYTTNTSVCPISVHCLVGFDIVDKVEGDVITYRVTKTDTSEATTVNWNVNTTGILVNPALPTDFLGGVFPSGVLNFALADASEDIVLNTVANNFITFEPNRSFRVTLTSPITGAIICNDIVATIEDLTTFHDVSFRFFTSQLATQVYTTVEEARVVSVDQIIDSQLYSFQISGNPIVFDAAGILNQLVPAGGSLTVTSPQTAFSDSLVKVRFLKPTQPASPSTFSYTFTPNTAGAFGFIDQDIMLGFTDKVTINSIIPNGAATLSYAIRTDTYLVQDYTSYPLNSYATLNAAILSAPTKYAVHIYVNWTTATTNSVTINLTYN